MEAHARGDPGAFPELFRRWAGRLFGYLRHMSGERELAMDLVQETFIRVHRARHRFDASRPFRPWVFRIATRVHTDLTRSWFWRLRRRTASLFGSGTEGARAWADRLPSAPAHEPPRVAEARDLAARLRGEVGRLREPYRQAIVLHDLEGLTCREIAEVTGRPVGTVLSWIRRGRAILRERLDETGGRGAWS
jgi:RNA polymerase sigma-70 factor (ECF subfamily)